MLLLLSNTRTCSRITHSPTTTRTHSTPRVCTPRALTSSLSTPRTLTPSLSTPRTSTSKVLTPSVTTPSSTSVHSYRLQRRRRRSRWKNQEGSPSVESDKYPPCREREGHPPQLGQRYQRRPPKAQPRGVGLPETHPREQDLVGGGGLPGGGTGTRKRGAMGTGWDACGWSL
ncbi:unnamed protein product [Closterium sp. NIES-54]